MPDSSSPVFEVRGRRRLALVLLGYIPLLHLLLVAGLAIAPWAAGWSLAWLLAVPVALYLVPPLAVRIAGWIRRPRHGKFPLDSGALVAWWFSAQWQVAFNRLPFLEELLRFVPGLYSTWLRLWGARVGGLVYWSPGCRILDRQLIHIGGRVVIAIGARLSPHLVTRERDGVPELWLAPIIVEEGAMVGAHALLGPGVRVFKGEMTPALQPVPPFCEWREGRRRKRHISIAG